MKVEEFVNNNNGRIKLGACDGGAFVYCGDIDNMSIEELDKKILYSFNRTKMNAKIRINALNEKPYEDWLKTQQINGTPESMCDYESYLSDRTRRIESAKRTLKDYTQRLKTWRSVGDREIIDVYDSILEPNTKVVIYDGRERGTAWTTEEYERGFNE